MTMTAADAKMEVTMIAVMIYYLFLFKATPHNRGVRIAKQDFSSGCTEKPPTCWRKSRAFCAS
ncbi:MAG: hypothetical protein PUB99_01865 [Oscillospiraceae bacterium]|nr:hypothetical protein [Oscillospiraceae bacterium]